MVLLVITPLCAFGDNSTKLERTGETIQIPYKLTLKQVEDAIFDGSIRRGWEPKKLSDGTIEDTLHIRSHTAVVHIVYTAESFRIDYADSTNLTTSGASGTAVFSTAQNSIFSAGNIGNITNKDSGEIRIHKNYYLWTQNLATYIMQSLGEAKNKSETSNAKSDCDAVPNKLRALEALRKEGVITTEEYQKKKQQLLQQL
jgi:hypothetical protein